MDYRLLPEPDLVTRFQCGDGLAGEELYHRYSQSVLRYCRYLLGDRDGAQDAAQETFFRMIGKVDTLRKCGSFRAWLFSIARNNCLMAARTSAREFCLEDPENVWEDGTPLTKILEGELRENVHKAIRSLKPIYREALMLREFESLSYREIADATHASVASVKFRIHTARQALASALGPYFNGEEMK